MGRGISPSTIKIIELPTLFHKLYIDYINSTRLVWTKGYFNRPASVSLMYLHCLPYNSIIMQYPFLTPQTNNYLLFNLVGRILSLKCFGF